MEQRAVARVRQARTHSHCLRIRGPGRISGTHHAVAGDNTSPYVTSMHVPVRSGGPPMHLPVASPIDSYVKISSLSFTYQSRQKRLTAVQDVSLDVRGGEFVSLIGPSGCGKSTLLRLVAGLLPSPAAAVRIGDLPAAAARRSKAIGWIAQDPALLPWQTVRENISLPLTLRPNAGGRRDPEALLRTIGLDAFHDFYPHQLSGGMQQRVALARALAADPPLLLMDEPFGALDELTRAQLRDELARLTEGSGKTVLLVTHSIVEAVYLSDRVLVMHGPPGRVRAVVDIDLPGPRGDRDETEQRFGALTRRLRDLLREVA